MQIMQNLRMRIESAREARIVLRYRSNYARALKIVASLRCDFFVTAFLSLHFFTNLSTHRSAAEFKRKTSISKPSKLMTKACSSVRRRSLRNVLLHLISSRISVRGGMWRHSLPDSKGVPSLVINSCTREIVASFSKSNSLVASRNLGVAHPINGTFN